MSDVPRPNARNIIDLTGSDDEFDVVDLTCDDPATQASSPVRGEPPTRAASFVTIDWSTSELPQEVLIRTHQHRFPISLRPRFVALGDCVVHADSAYGIRALAQVNSGDIRVDYSECGVLLGPRASDIRLRALTACFKRVVPEDRALANRSLKRAVDEWFSANERGWGHVIERLYLVQGVSDDFVCAMSAWPFISFQTGVVFLVFAAFVERYNVINQYDINYFAEYLAFVENANFTRWDNFLADEPAYFFKMDTKFVTVDIADHRTHMSSIFVPSWERFRLMMQINVV